ncbi:RagB/SusD family nutrient uptake outer membrane protein [Hymenobacter aerilatus]|uniref:RagB/SusD family nutrient uptake outer membrane protein n=1 Tax=Hymenobacter aerilatus TaxID=2932251 RepID=A0A8T9SZU2_9BACT|nr:RagB/SusD family nutrient uptake outer membrane protein [Hymenobacter aerilatus]UOR07137.1 RagB/SusD family nutrient uptake outer membrane protein [Hymenobacter aerilatus]
MKKTIYSAFLASALVFSSCDKDYLDTAPTSAVTEEDVLTNTKNAMAALNGIHRILYLQHNSSQNQGGEGSMKIMMDALGEDWVQTLGTSWWASEHNWISHRNAASTSSYNHAWYYFYYRIISNANMLINGLENATGPEADKKMVIGEALVYRAWAHFQLVQVFGERYDASKDNTQLGVPLMTTNTTEGQPRATVKDVYAQVNKDLDDAITTLTGLGARPAKSHFNAAVAKGIKARVALAQQNWADAAKFAQEAIQQSGATLMSRTQYTSGFNNVDNPEWIWGSKMQADQTNYFYSFFAYMSANFNSTAIRQNPKKINSVLYDQLPTTDVRRQLWDPAGTSIPAPANGVKAKYGQKKFLVADPSLSIGDVPHMRLAELYLILAEAQARQNNAAAAATLFTLVSARDPQYVRSTKTGQALVDEILTQRRVELWGEGFRFLDLKRTNSPLNRTGANHLEQFAWAIRVGNLRVEPGAKEWQFLFPQSEINVNKAIVQNPL